MSDHGNIPEHTYQLLNYTKIAYSQQQQQNSSTVACYQSALYVPWPTMLLLLLLC